MGLNRIQDGTSLKIKIRVIGHLRWGDKSVLRGRRDLKLRHLSIRVMLRITSPHPRIINLVQIKLQIMNGFIFSNGFCTSIPCAKIVDLYKSIRM